MSLRNSNEILASIRSQLQLPPSSPNALTITYDHLKRADLPRELVGILPLMVQVPRDAQKVVAKEPLVALIGGSQLAARVRDEVWFTRQYRRILVAQHTFAHICMQELERGKLPERFDAGRLGRLFAAECLVIGSLLRMTKVEEPDLALFYSPVEVATFIRDYPRIHSLRLGRTLSEHTQAREGLVVTLDRIHDQQ